jgi:hypothetical protein
MEIKGNGMVYINHEKHGTTPMPCLNRNAFDDSVTNWDKSRECMYDKSATDKRCGDCKWRVL